MVEDLSCQPFILPNKDIENVNSECHHHLLKTDISHTKVNRFIFMRNVTILRFSVFPLYQVETLSRTQPVGGLAPGVSGALRPAATRRI